MTAFAPGDRVNWLYKGRGGYDHLAYNVAGIVVSVTPKRVSIQVAQKLRGAWILQQRSVTPERLSPRTKLVPQVDRAVPS